MAKPWAVGVCQRTGFKVPANELMEEWTGLMVWAPYYEEKHPLLDPPAPRGERIRSNATGPEQDNDIGDDINDAPSIEELGANN